MDQYVANSSKQMRVGLLCSSKRWRIVNLERFISLLLWSGVMVKCGLMTGFLIMWNRLRMRVLIENLQEKQKVNKCISWKINETFKTNRTQPHTFRYIKKWNDPDPLFNNKPLNDLQLRSTSIRSQLSLLVLRLAIHPSIAPWQSCCCPPKRVNVVVGAWRCLS